jgi:hypothetical protein
MGTQHCRYGSLSVGIRESRAECHTMGRGHMIQQKQRKRGETNLIVPRTATIYDV